MDEVLAAATGGLPLMLEAYRAFITGGEDRRHRAAATTALRPAASAHSGPPALWRALEDNGAIEGRELLCAVAALLPPTGCRRASPSCSVAPPLPSN